MNFGEKLKTERLKNKMSQDDLANLLNVNRVAISNYETNKNTPTFENMKKLEQIFKINFSGYNDIKSNFIPLIGKASCGIPKDYDLNGYEPVPVTIEMYKSGMYAVEAEGDSMSPKINDGDIVYCCPAQHIDSGKIVHYWLNGESGIKRYKINESGTIISLIPLNSDYDIINIHHDETFDLRMAKVVGKIDKDF